MILIALLIAEIFHRRPASPIVTPAPVPAWKTFSDDGNFTFDYPSSWESPTRYEQSTHTEYVFPANLSIRVGFSYDQNRQRPLTYEEELADLKKYSVSAKPVTVAGIPTRMYYGKVLHGGVRTIDVLLTSPTGLLTQISFSDYGSEEEFVHLLSTFRFLPSPAPALPFPLPSGWQVIKNTGAEIIVSNTSAGSQLLPPLPGQAIVHIGLIHSATENYSPGPAEITASGVSVIKWGRFLDRSGSSAITTYYRRGDPLIPQFERDIKSLLASYSK
jgi:hypothetical protein